MKRTPIESQNPIFTELLDKEPEGGEVDKKWPLYTSANDQIPSRVPQQFDDGIEPNDLLAPGDENSNPEKWPHRLARPTLAIETGSIPIYKL
jgi:hypothetical protein